ncbi:patatin-like phospholipase family protein [Ferrimonas gelatinilytica]|uniref:Patatin-like phospholipase family protein n=1 Tax=Ferrimonas gelatinilytica TaxID=1255257 RepID=A0ABP9S9E2_9GAMM
MTPIARMFVVSVLALSWGLAMAEERPKIGVALSGGGAKGAAHIGVLRVLEEQRVPVDVIAGTSMGAYVAGLYSLGLSADEIQARMDALDFNTGFSDEIPRRQLNFREKAQRDYFPIDPKMGFNEGEFTLPKGLLEGQTMSVLVRRSLGPVPEVPDFDQLPIPLRTVATDLASREPKVFSSGNLAIAMQASMTVPGALAPVEVDGRLLVDGGLVNNLPVDQVKAMGADIVIAVDIGAPLMEEEELDSVVSVLGQLSSYLTNISRDQQVALLTERDLLVIPDINGVGVSDFDKMPEMVIRGETAMYSQLDELAPLSLSEAEYRKYREGVKSRRQQFLHAARPVVALTLNNDSWLRDREVRSALGLKLGHPLSQEEIEEAVTRVYALNEFERVDAVLREHPDGDELVVTARGKSWGPNLFDVGLRFEDNFEDDLDLGVDVAFTAKDLLKSRLEWRNELSLGTDKRFSTELYRTLDPLRRYYARVQYQFEDRRWDFLLDEAFARIRLVEHSVLGGIGVNLGRNWQLELNYQYSDGDYAPLPEGTQGKYARFHAGGPQLQLGYDTLNNSTFPTHGSRVILAIAGPDSYSKLLPASGLEGVENGSLWRSYLEWIGANQWGRHNLIGKAELQGLDQDGLHLSQVTAIGGFLNLSGYNKDALVGSNKVLLGGVYRYNLQGTPLGITWPLYVGFSLEAGNVWYDRDNASLSDLIYAGSVFASTYTRFGPLAVGYGHADSGEGSVYFFFGRPF